MVLTSLVHDNEIANKLGEFIAPGSTRDVFRYRDEESWVIKQHRFQPHISNLTEWIIWQQINEIELLRNVFGECVAMSTSGRYLVMEMLSNLSETDGPQTLEHPIWLTDRKLNAFGRSHSGKIKIRDYGQIALGPTLAHPRLECIKAFR